MGVDNEKGRWKWVKGEEEKKWKENGEWERERRDEHQASEAGVLRWSEVPWARRSVTRDYPVVQGSVDASDMEMQV
jgi:hypothetical protein